MPDTLDSRRIDLWFAFCATVTDTGLLERYRSLLTEPERAQEQRFYFARDRHRYLITRALVRTTLSRYVDVRPQDWTFRTNAYGRPEISNDIPGARHLSFNISHTSQLVVLGVTRELALGVDTEDGYTRHPPLEIADRFFAPREVSDLRALAPEHQPERFFQYWTLKESYIKARGMGLSIPLDQFAFRFSGGEGGRQISLTTEPALNDDASQWRFWQFRVRDGHMVAVCARPTAEQLVLKEIVPLSGEGDLNGEPIAAGP